MEQRLRSRGFSRGLWDQFQDRAFRHSFMARNIRRGISYQLRAMRKARGNMSQKELAEITGKKQSAISRDENPTAGQVNIQTLIDYAKAFDVALIVKFVPFSELILETQDLSPEALNASSFDDDMGMKGPIATSMGDDWNVGRTNIFSDFPAPGRRKNEAFPTVRERAYVYEARV